MVGICPAKKSPIAAVDHAFVQLSLTPQVRTFDYLKRSSAACTDIRRRPWAATFCRPNNTHPETLPKAGERTAAPGFEPIQNQPKLPFQRILKTMDTPQNRRLRRSRAPNLPPQESLPATAGARRTCNAPALPSIMTEELWQFAQVFPSQCAQPANAVFSQRPVVLARLSQDILQRTVARATHPHLYQHFGDVG